MMRSIVLYLTESEVLGRASLSVYKKSASRVLTEDRATASDTFDVLLSHSSAEPEDKTIQHSNQIIQLDLIDIAPTLFQYRELIPRLAGQ
jgi:hypothetical protein